MVYLYYVCVGCGVVMVSFALLLLLVVVFAALAVNPRTGVGDNYGDSSLLSTPPPPLRETLPLKIVTYNIAAAHLFTTNRPERLRAIGAMLTELDPDIVGIQEAFIARDQEILFESLAGSRLQYHVNFPAATVGNGLLILSAWPIVEHYFHRFEHNNPWYKLYQGDWWAGKGIGLARIQRPDGSVIDFYNTHAQATRRDDANRAVRFEQMDELAQFINDSRLPTSLAFITGDFNTKMGRPDLERAMTEARLKSMMAIDSGIDFIFAVESPSYDIQVIETVEVKGETQGSKAAIFLSRAPTPREMKGIYLGPGEMTPLSDHTGYMTTMHITPMHPDKAGE